ncbi:MAG: SIS domain-containing protein [Flavobacteriales bacterium]
MHLCDWCSFYLAELNGVDAMEVEVIDRLKSQLARC